MSYGPECGKDYEYSHCVAGNVYGCVINEQCNCEAGVSPQKVGTVHQESLRKDSSNGTARLNAIGAVIKGPTAACSVVGNVCCSNAIVNCPHKDSNSKCSAERLQGIDDGPECAAKINYGHCVNGARLYCLTANNCDCDSAPMPATPQQAYDGSIGKVRDAPTDALARDTMRSCVPSGGLVIALGIAISAAVAARASMVRAHTRLGRDEPHEQECGITNTLTKTAQEHDVLF